MAKLYFRYGSMNCGKSTQLIQVAHNYEERGMRVLIIKPGADTKGGERVVSRIGASRPVDRIVTAQADVRQIVHEEEEKRGDIDCILVDEAQFLSPAQVEQLYALVLDEHIPVIAYGLRTDFQGEGFPGSDRLLELAHSIDELKNICSCGKKAVMNIRLIDGKPTFSGQQVAIDGTEKITYESVCADHYFEERRKQGLPPLNRLDK